MDVRELPLYQQVKQKFSVFAISLLARLGATANLHRDADPDLEAVHHIWWVKAAND